MSGWRRDRSSTADHRALVAVLFAAMGCVRGDHRSPRAPTTRAPTTCAPWSRCVRSMAAAGSTILFAVSESAGRETVLSTSPVLSGVPLRVNLVGASMRVGHDGTPQTPLWCRGDEPDCAPTATTVLAFGDHVGPPWVTFASDGALRLRERPPWTNAQPTHPLPLPPGLVPRAVSGSSSVVCALASSGRVLCWHRLDIDPAARDAGRARGIEVTALSDADNEELVVGPSPRFGSPLVCTRTRRGIARCVWLSDTAWPDVPPLIASVAEIHGWIEPVAGLALSTHELCARSADGRVACAIGPDRSDAFALSGTVTLRPVAGLQGAAQLAVVPGLGCARWSDGHVRCWGPSLRAAPARRAEEPVVIPALDGATQLVAVTDFNTMPVSGTVDGVCALVRGAFRCVGQDRRGRCIHDDRYAAAAQSGAPWDPALRGSFHAAAYHLPALRGGSEEVREGLCGLRDDGAVVCEGAGPLDAPRSVHWTRLSSVGELLCAADPAGAAWCTSDGTLRRTPALDGFVSLAAVDGEVCALGTPRGARCARCDAESTCRSTQGSARDLVGVDGLGCALTSRGERRCGEGVPGAGSSIPAELIEALGGAVREVSGHFWVTCVLGVSGRVACDHGDGAWRIEGPGDARALAVSGLVCVIRVSGVVVCWGDNVANTLAFAAGGARSNPGVPRVTPVSVDRPR